MGTYKARKNDENNTEEPKSYEEQKQESTEKAVDLAGEAALDYFTGGQGSKIKNMAENVPIVGGAVKNTWDGAVKGVSKVVSKTPVGDILKKADDSGVTDAARTAKDAISMKNGNIKANDDSTSNKTASNSNTKNSGFNSSSNKKEKNSGFNMFGTFNIKLPLILKIRIIVILSCVFLFFMMFVAVFANDDVKNLGLTNNSEMMVKDSKNLTQEEIENRLVYVGEVSGMESQLSKDGISYITGSGYDWLSTEGINKLEETFQNKTAPIIVISSGINDLNNIDNYIMLYKNLMNNYPDANIFVMSINPVDETKTSITNNQIEGFNKKLSESFGANYIDTYSKISNFNTLDDGITYDADSINQVNNIVTNILMNSGQIKSTVGNGDIAAKLEEVAKWYIKNVKTYQVSPCGNKGSGHRKYYNSPFLSRAIGDDCTEFAGVFMSYVCGVELPASYSGEMVNRNGNWAKTVSSCGWKAYSTDEIGELQFGDVLIADTSVSYSDGRHAEVFVNSSQTFGWGSCKSDYPVDNIIRKETYGGHTVYSDSHRYVTVYRYEGA